MFIELRQIAIEPQKDSQFILVSQKDSQFILVSQKDSQFILVYEFEKISIKGSLSN